MMPRHSRYYQHGALNLHMFIMLRRVQLRQGAAAMMPRMYGVHPETELRATQILAEEFIRTRSRHPWLCPTMTNMELSLLILIMFRRVQGKEWLP